MTAVVVLLALSALTLGADDMVVEKETNTSFAMTLGEDPTLELLGVAPRIKNILGVYGAKVYGIGMYVDPKALDIAIGDRKKSPTLIAAAVRAMSGDRAFVLKFVRDLEKQVMVDAFKEAIEISLPVDDPKIADDAKTFLAAFRDIKNGDVATMYFSGNKAMLFGNDEKLVEVENRTLSRALISAFIGINPVDERVKRELLAGIK